jgi:serine/threonine protein phosphatase 1
LRFAPGFFDAFARSRRADEDEAAAAVQRDVEPPAASPDDEIAAVHYGVGDIHGMRRLLDELIARIEADAGDDPAVVVFLGDLVNRGPKSRQVLERLIEGPSRPGDRWISLRGNHDQLMLDAVAGRSEATFRRWMQKGGLETLASYGVSRKEASPARARRAIPSAHLAFLDGLPFSYRAGEHFFVHAGIDPRRPLDRQSEEAMMNIREPFLRDSHLLPFTVIHGHVPSPGGPVVAARRIGVDTGAYASGVLTAVALREGRQPDFLATVGEPARGRR